MPADLDAKRIPTLMLRRVQIFLNSERPVPAPDGHFSVNLCLAHNRHILALGTPRSWHLGLTDSTSSVPGKGPKREAAPLQEEQRARKQKEITCELIRSGFRIDCGPFRLYLVLGTAKRDLSTICHLSSNDQFVTGGETPPRRYGIAFVSLCDNLDLSTPSGRLMFQIIGVMAEFERSLIQRESGPDFATSSSKGRL